MKSLRKLALLLLGLFLFALGTVLAINSRLGSSPWDTFHRGLAGKTGLTLGQVTQCVGAVIILLDIAMAEIPGRASLLNMYFVGFFIDLIQKVRLVPEGESMPGRVAMLLSGIFVMGWGSFFYMNTGWGAGPRDSLMLGLSKSFSTEVWKARTAMEAFATAGGLALGVKPGFGTIAIVLLVGPAVQMSFRIARKDVKTVVHRTLVDDYRDLSLAWKRRQSAHDAAATKSATPPGRE